MDMYGYPRWISNPVQQVGYVPLRPVYIWPQGAVHAAAAGPADSAEGSESGVVEWHKFRSGFVTVSDGLQVERSRRCHSLHAKGPGRGGARDFLGGARGFVGGARAMSQCRISVGTVGFMGVSCARRSC